MRDDWPAWARSAWRTIPEPHRSAHETVLETLVDGFDGVVVSPAPLVRRLVDQARLGHRSTLEAIGRLVAKGLLHARTADDATVLWVPAELMPDDDRDPPASLRPRFAAGRLANGTPPDTPSPTA